jgi:hypothetical protein
MEMEIKYEIIWDIHMGGTVQRARDTLWSSYIEYSLQHVAYSILVILNTVYSIIDQCVEQWT